MSRGPLARFRRRSAPKLRRRGPGYESRRDAEAGSPASPRPAASTRPRFWRRSASTRSSPRFRAATASTRRWRPPMRLASGCTPEMLDEALAAFSRSPFRSPFATPPLRHRGARRVPRPGARRRTSTAIAGIGGRHHRARVPALSRTRPAVRLRSRSADRGGAAAHAAPGGPVPGMGLPLRARTSSADVTMTLSGTGLDADELQSLRRQRSRPLAAAAPPDAVCTPNNTQAHRAPRRVRPVSRRVRMLR